MKINIRVYVALFGFILLINPLFLFCQQPEPGKEKENVTSFLEKKHPFEDAKQLDEVVINGEIQKNKIKLVLQILAKYIEDAALKKEMDSPDKWDGDLGDRLIEAFKISTPKGRVEHPFLGEYLKILKKTLQKYENYIPDPNAPEKTHKSVVYKQAPITPEVVKEAPAKGILSPVMVVDALGRLIAERFKEELAIAYLTKFRAEVKKNRLRRLFPTTADFLVNSDIFNFKLFIPTLKDAFQNDLNNLDSNLKKFLIEHRRVLEKYFEELFKKELEEKNYKELFKEEISGKIEVITKEIVGIRSEISKLKEESESINALKKKLEEKEKELSNLLIIELEKIKIEAIKKKIDDIETEIEVLEDEIRDLVERDRDLRGEIDSKEEKKKEKEDILSKLKVLEKTIDNKDILNFAILILDLFQDIKEGEHAVQIIDNIDKSPYLEKIDPKVSSPIRILALVSRNLRNKKGDGWIETTEFKTLIESGKKNQRKLFVGLIYAREVDKLDNITIDGKKLNTIITVDKIDKTIAYLEQIIDVTKKIKDKISDIKNIENKGEKVGYEKYHAYLSKVFELIHVGIDISKLTGKEEVEKKITEYLGYARRLLEISKNIHDKAYGIALVNGLELLRQLLPDESVIKKGILKYGTFMVNLVKAKDSKEMKKVLEAAVLPVGSYRIKRSSRFNISFNAYPGGFIGAEKLTPGEQEIKGEPLALNLAFTAPVGFAFSWGKERKIDDNTIKLGPSYSVFLSAIDIGAVVSFRLSGADSGLPEFKWQNILAPGLYIMKGFKNSPISIGVGIQYGPQLREIRAAETANGTNGTNANGENGENDSQQVAEGIIKSSAFRVGLIFAVDIPIFNIHSKN
jgi:prefoldin subunit 5